MTIITWCVIFGAHVVMTTEWLRYFGWTAPICRNGRIVEWKLNSKVDKLDIQFITRYPIKNALD